MPELTKQQIERQDYVDNQITALVNSVLPQSKEIDWNIERIAEVREVLRKIAEDLAIDEMDFYPYLKP